jgi:hypothetical protein
MTRRAFADVGVARCALMNLRVSYAQELALLRRGSCDPLWNLPPRLKMKDWKRLVLQVQCHETDEMPIHRSCNNF